MTRDDFLKRLKKPKQIPTWVKVHYLSGFALGVVFGWLLAECLRLI